MVVQTMIRLLAIILPLFAFVPAGAEQFWAAELRITGVAVVAKDSKHPAFSDIVWVGVHRTDWLSGGCAEAAAGGLAFPASNRTLYDLVVRAAEGERRVTMKAEDTDKIGDLCRLVQVTVYYARD
jgi:hypothetical protein